MAETYDNDYALKMAAELSKNSRKCNSIEDYLELAYSFRFDNFSIVPIQIKNEIHQLLQILEKRRPKTLLEIGTANGGTLFLLCNIAEEEATILSIDLPAGPFGGEMFPEWKMTLYKSFAQNKQKIHLIRSDSHDIETLKRTKKLLGKQKLEFLLIDGDHTYDGVKKDFEVYSQLVEDGGIIAFHDINPGPKDNVGGVPEFWNEIKWRLIQIANLHWISSR